MTAVKRNSLILFASESLSSVLMLLSGLIVARGLSVADFGTFMSAFAFATLVAIGVDAGMGMLAARDIARGRAADHPQLNELFTWRLWVIGGACIAVTWIASGLFPSGEVRRVAIGLTPGVLLVGLTDFFCWIFKGAQRVIWCAVLQITTRILLLGLSVLALSHPRPLWALTWVYSVAGFTMALVGLVLLARAMQALKTVRLPARFFRQTLPTLYKMGAIVILSVAFTRVDLLLINRLLGESQAGLFAAAGRIIDALRLLPMVLYSVYLPLFSSLHDDPHQLRAHFWGAEERLLLAAVILAVAGNLFAGPLLTTLFGAPYSQAANSFRALMWSCIPMFSNILLFSLLVALNDHRTPFAAIVAALALEVFLNWQWLPRFGIEGAGWARFLAEMVNGAILACGVVKTGLFTPRRPQVVAT